MKIKKILTILLTSMLLLTSSTSVFASETTPEAISTITPTAVGFGDSKAQAIPLLNGDRFTSYLASSTDEDWYKWTNNTGSLKYVGAFYQPQTFDGAYRLGMEIDYTPTRSLLRVYASDFGNPSNPGIIINPLIPPGATVYFIIDSVNYATKVYTFDFRVYDF
ncbi:hypothetical protein J2Z32_004203 [Paenibacillus turicensis]|uniref:Uncharacterized protein n=1 Tax=Paenibacillus turicensis TaxID=160487 RepID=A0ABS4FYV1_9BACL|nr:hypothetical protein [Paenibacillus turicensis]MBP1907528.1 hypothetical protein [Paenibacillus turicensis]